MGKKTFSSNKLADIVGPKLVKNLQNLTELP